MTVFEFATTLWSIMFSIAFAHMLANLAGLLQLGRQVRWSPLRARRDQSGENDPHLRISKRGDA